MASNLLKILPDDNSLHGKSPFLEKIPAWNESNSQQPRALRSLGQIIENGLCHRCGSCVGICPTDTLGLDENCYPKVKNLSACTDCDLCVKTCPGDEFNFHAAHQDKFATPGKIEDTHGEFSESFIAYANDPYIREHSTSGGLVTAILLGLMEAGEIDGAVVIASDPKELWKGRPILARTKEEILLSLKSKYAISPTNSVFSQIREMPGRYALVGLPCQIHGFIKARELDAKLKERVVLTIGLFCHAAVEHEGYRIVWESIPEADRKIAQKFISRVGKHPGTPHLLMPDGTYKPVYFPEKTGYRPSSMEVINILYRLYSPKRCLTCFDALALFADISIGDPWLPPPDDDVDFLGGWSFALIRNPKAKEICDQLKAKNKITVRDLTRREALSCNVMMSNEKLWRASRIIETHKRQGKAVPKYTEYDLNMPKHSLKHFLKTEINMFTHMFCFIPKFRAPLLKLTLSNFGYYCLWLNNLRRILRTTCRDQLAKARRKLFGRK